MHTLSKCQYYNDCSRQFYNYDFFLRKTSCQFNLCCLWIMFLRAKLRAKKKIPERIEIIERTGPWHRCGLFMVTRKKILKNKKKKKNVDTKLWCDFKAMWSTLRTNNLEIKSYIYPVPINSWGLDMTNLNSTVCSPTYAYKQEKISRRFFFFFKKTIYEFFKFDNFKNV